MEHTSRGPADRLLLEAVAAAEPRGVTRTELVGILGQSATSVSTALDRLGRALVTEDGDRTGRSGPAPKVLRIPRNSGAVLAFEINPSRLRAWKFDARGHSVGEVRSESAGVEDNPMDTLRRLAEIARELSRDDDVSRIIGVGIAVAGPVDPGAGGGDLRHGVLREDAMMRRWGGISPATELEQQLLWRCPFLVDNDSTLAAVAELRWGAARGKGDVIYVGWSRGIGAGLVVDGRVARGFSGIAGEIGHCTVLPPEDQGAPSSPESSPDGAPACPRCGRHCLESVAGVGAILADAGLDPDAPASELFAAATAEDMAPTEHQAVTRGIRRAAGFMGQVLGTCVNLLNPELIVIGGDFSAAPAGVYRGELMSALKRHAIGASFSDVGVVPSELGNDAALRGAAAHVLERELPSFLLSL